MACPMRLRLAMIEVDFGCITSARENILWLNPSVNSKGFRSMTKSELRSGCCEHLSGGSVVNASRCDGYQINGAQESCVIGELSASCVV